MANYFSPCVQVVWIMLHAIAIDVRLEVFAGYAGFSIKVVEAVFFVPLH
jgi:hypothetical protein